MDRPLHGIVLPVMALVQTRIAEQDPDHHFA
jgi:hypothetical protein